MPLNVVRGQDIRSREEELAVQEVVNLRLETTPLDLDIKRNDVPDIKTKEDEIKWQKIIDERTRKARGLPAEAIVVQPILTEVVAEPVVSEPVLEKKRMGRSPKSELCTMCKMKDHVTDCPLKEVSI